MPSTASPSPAALRDSGTPAAALSTADREALHDLIIEHAWLLDHGRWHDVAALYDEDATLRIGPRELRGRGQMLAWADHRATTTSRLTHHQCTNIRVQSDAVGTATGTVMVVLYVSDGGAAHVELVGEYRDQYRLDDHGRWHFRARELHALQPPAADNPPGASNA